MVKRKSLSLLFCHTTYCNEYNRHGMYMCTMDEWNRIQCSFSTDLSVCLQVMLKNRKFRVLLKGEKEYKEHPVL